MWSDVAKRLKSQFDPEMVRRVKEAGVQILARAEGFASRDRFVWLNAADGIRNEAGRRTHFEPFGSIVPSLVQASQRAYPRSLLTKRETGYPRASRHGSDHQADCGCGRDQ